MTPVVLFAAAVISMAAAIAFAEPPAPSGRPNPIPPAELHRPHIWSPGAHVR